MPFLAYGVSGLQQKVADATVGNLVHANNVLHLAKRCVQQNQKLRFLDLGDDCRMELQHGHGKSNKKSNQCDLGFAAVHDASFMGQPKDASQCAYCLLLCSTRMYEGKARAHLIDWGSSKIHRKMRSTLACEASSATRAFDRGTYVRTMWYEIQHGWKHIWEREPNHNTDDVREEWSQMCQKIPFALGTDCKSLYDVCTKNGSMPEERRVALDLLDIRESIEEFGDKIRWIPTDHMLVDCMTKSMPPDAILGFMKNMEYALKYDDVIKSTKREIAKTRKRKKEAEDSADLDRLSTQLEENDDVNLVDHYDIYYQMFLVLHPTQPTTPMIFPTLPLWNHYQQEKQVLGYRPAYRELSQALCVGIIETSSTSE